MIRIVVAGTLLAALAGSSALAQGSYQHHRFCLRAGSGTECAFDSMSQCQAARHNDTESCVPNSAPINH